ncbi:MAG TPA: DMT family transporter [Ilumatobacteraceae bacterium]|nr:DMT family transporter [Ilumatobacteraceae bacterium]
MTERFSGRTLGLIAMLIAVVSFATSSSLIKWSESTGSVVAFWRMIGAVLGWWTVLVVLNRHRGRPFPTRVAWRAALLPGLFFGANITLFFTAINKTSIAHAEFIGAMTPLVLLPLGALMFDERPNWHALRWGGLSILGVMLVLFFGPGQGVSSIGGDVLMIGVLALWTGYLLSSKRARTSGVGTLDFMSCMMPIGVLVAGPIAAMIAGSDVFTLSARGWLVVAILTLLTGMLSHGCIVFAQQHIPIATIGIMQTAQPALAVLFGFLILGEAVRAPQAAGMVLVISGLALFTASSQRAASSGRLEVEVDNRHTVPGQT